MPATYDTKAPDYARHRSSQQFVVETLARLRARAPGDQLLEVGCGTCDYAASMAESAAGAVYALDPSPGMLRYGACVDRLFRVQGDAVALPFADDSLDMIYSVNMVHHLASAGPYFGEAARVLRSGGMMCTATDSEAIIRRRKPLTRYWPSTVPVELARYHDIAVLEEAMSTAGFGPPSRWEGRETFTIVDAGPYRDKAFSCLGLIPDEDFARGLDAMETDLGAGPLEGASELLFLWAERL